MYNIHFKTREKLILPDAKLTAIHNHNGIILIDEAQNHIGDFDASVQEYIRNKFTLPVRGTYNDEPFGSTFLVQAERSVAVREYDVRGTRYYEENIVKLLNSWQQNQYVKIYLASELNNDHDRGAVAVNTNHGKLGYISRHEKVGVINLFAVSKDMSVEIQPIDYDGKYIIKLFVIFYLIPLY